MSSGEYEIPTSRSSFVSIPETESSVTVKTPMGGMRGRDHVTRVSVSAIAAALDGSFFPPLGLEIFHDYSGDLALNYSVGADKDTQNYNGILVTSQWSPPVPLGDFSIVPSSFTVRRAQYPMPPIGGEFQFLLLFSYVILN